MANSAACKKNEKENAKRFNKGINASLQQHFRIIGITTPTAILRAYTSADSYFKSSKIYSTSTCIGLYWFLRKNKHSAPADIFHAVHLVCFSIAWVYFPKNETADAWILVQQVSHVGEDLIQRPHATSNAKYVGILLYRIIGCWKQSFWTTFFLFWLFLRQGLASLVNLIACRRLVMAAESW